MTGAMRMQQNRHCEKEQSSDEAIQKFLHQIVLKVWIAAPLRGSQCCKLFEGVGKFQK